MRMPGFTGELALTPVSKPYYVSKSSEAPEKHHQIVEGQALIPQFGWTKVCHWECFPGTGCGYFCESFPY